MSEQGYDHEADFDELELAERCIRDDSTECDCPRCTAAEDRFWREQEGVLDDEDDREPDGYRDEDQP